MGFLTARFDVSFEQATHCPQEGTARRIDGKCRIVNIESARVDSLEQVLQGPGPQGFGEDPVGYVELDQDPGGLRVILGQPKEVSVGDRHNLGRIICLKGKAVNGLGLAFGYVHHDRVDNRALVVEVVVERPQTDISQCGYLLDPGPVYSLLPEQDLRSANQLLAGLLTSPDTAVRAALIAVGFRGHPARVPNENRFKTEKTFS